MFFRCYQHVFLRVCRKGDAGGWWLYQWLFMNLAACVFITIFQVVYIFSALAGALGSAHLSGTFGDTQGVSVASGFIGGFVCSNDAIMNVMCIATDNIELF